MVQMSLFIGQDSRCRPREWTCGSELGEGEEEGGVNEELEIDIYSLPCVKSVVGSHFIAQGAQLGAL